MTGLLACNTNVQNGYLSNGTTHKRESGFKQDRCKTMGMIPHVLQAIEGARIGKLVSSLQSSPPFGRVVRGIHSLIVLWWKCCLRTFTKQPRQIHERDVGFVTPSLVCIHDRCHRKPWRVVAKKNHNSTHWVPRCNSQRLYVGRLRVGFVDLVILSELSQKKSTAHHGWTGWQNKTALWHPSCEHVQMWCPMSSNLPIKRNGDVRLDGLLHQIKAVDGCTRSCWTQRQCSVKNSSIIILINYWWWHLLLKQQTWIPVLWKIDIDAMHRKTPIKFNDREVFHVQCLRNGVTKMATDNKNNVLL